MVCSRRLGTFAVFAGLILTVVLLYIQPGGVAAQVRPSTQQPCASDRLEILRTGVEWLLADQSYAPQLVVLDTVASGMKVDGPERSRGVAMDVLHRLAEEVGLLESTREDAIECIEEMRETQCRLRSGRILMVVHPPRLTRYDNEIEFNVLVVGRLDEEVSWSGRMYLLTLRRAQGWRVVEGRVVGMS